jgi:very-short-patch-repair endonuclease
VSTKTEEGRARCHTPPLHWGTVSTPEAVLARRASEHHGVFSLAAARTAGLTEGALRRRLVGGSVARLHEGVYRFVAAPETWRTGVAAAVLAAGASAVASHRSAARLWALRDVPRWAPEVTALGRRLPDVEGVVVHRTDRLDDLDRAVVDGIPCTSVARTLLDLGAVVHRTVVRTATRDAALRGLTTLVDLVCILERIGGPGRRGTAALRWTIRQSLPDARLESRLEVALLRLVRSAGLPPAAVQHELHCHDGRLVRLDLAWPERGIAVEADGRRWHSTSAEFERDMARANSISASGWILYRFGWNDVHQRPASVQALLRRAFSVTTAA